MSTLLFPGVLRQRGVSNCVEAWKTVDEADRTDHTVNNKTGSTGDDTRPVLWRPLSHVAMGSADARGEGGAKSVRVTFDLTPMSAVFNFHAVKGSFQTLQWPDEAGRAQQVVASTFLPAARTAHHPSIRSPTCWLLWSAERTWWGRWGPAE